MPRKSYIAGIAGSVVACAAMVPSAQALDFKLSGQVNRAIIAADNGEDADVGFVDNHSSISRFGFSGSQEINPNLTVGFQYVEGLGSNQSDDFDINQNSTEYDLQNRQANVYLKGSLGKLTLGKQDGAANSTSKVDYSGTTDLGGGTVVDDYFGGVSLMSDDGNSAVAIGSVYDSYDALSRVNAVRYDTPTYGGFKVSASFDEGRAVEIAPKFKTEFANGTKFAFALDYVNSGQRNKEVEPNGDVAQGFNDSSQFNEYGGSASVLLPSGLNFTLQYKRRDYSNTYYGSTGDTEAVADTKDHSQTFFGGVGYRVGKNRMQLFYGQTDGKYTDDSKARNYGVAYVYNLKKSVNLYASYHHVAADNLNLAGGGAQDANVVFSGLRVKFF
ncbi:porin [Salinisphaera sp. USBA-960]|uniref:porin n=1 Tax=Salinisphaera orenii TaxID=856731 RepID=UPI000DBE1873|nr:porin [Salifodinibacter halophilus]NNC26566.1 porin [Salifodinibacter halophilus]